jgi:3-deoxy-manno-octulosonate cytidylyltransferase (CMP-KDO synthetase)
MREPKMKIIGLIPGRMAATRFPGKPMMNICGMPMIGHVYRRAELYSHWDYLAITTCDEEIKEYAAANSMPVIMTGAHHTRALDRVAEAASTMSDWISDSDIVVCVQGDEPLLRPDMIDAVIAPLIKSDAIKCALLAMDIDKEDIWLNPDTVKIIHNESGIILYTSRSPIPYGKTGFNKTLKAKRIYGIFAFRWRELRAFTAHNETFLEVVESCDSNRILDMNFDQYIAPYPAIESYSVDSPNDLIKVESVMPLDPFWKKYKI